ncbi:MAG: hypothetical protein CFE25_00590 [Chitinophagaceae bacterium BSSC1]|nr:MAG: hypothetical protein CFE25_00590 [Chitinophagaceae bacterium BSSC1]
MASHQTGKSSKHYPYASYYFALALIITWVGFSQSYFGRLNQVTIYHHIHGALAGGWILVLIIQPILYQQGKLVLHRKIGKLAGYLFFPLLLLGGLKMIHSMLNSAAAYPPGAVNRLAYLDFVSVLLLIIFFYQGISKAKQLQLHARNMSMTVLIMLPPAIARMLFLIPWFDSFDKTLNAAYGIIVLILGILLLDDHKKGKIYPTYVLGIVGVAFMLISQNLVGDWQWWANWMAAYAAL